MSGITFNIANDFLAADKDNLNTVSGSSGSLLYEKFLKSEFDKAVAEDSVLRVNFDDVLGYSTPFLKSSFGNLARHYKTINHGSLQDIFKHLKIISNIDPYLEYEVKKYIQEGYDKG